MRKMRGGHYSKTKYGGSPPASWHVSNHKMGDIKAQVHGRKSARSRRGMR